MATRTNDRASCNDSCCARSSGVVALWLLAVLVMYASSKLSLMLQLYLVLKAIIARQAAQYFVALPVVEDPGHVLARNAGHGGEIVLPDLLMDDDPARTDFLPEMIRQLEHRLSDAAFERKEATGRNRRVCLAQALSQKPVQRFVDFGVFVCKSFKLGAAEKAHCGIAHCHHGCRTRQSVNDRKLSDDVAPAEKRKYALGAETRNHRNLEESVLDAIAAVAGSAGPKQDLARGEPYPFRVGKKLRRNIRRQFGQQTKMSQPTHQFPPPKLR